MLHAAFPDIINTPSMPMLMLHIANHDRNATRVRE